MRVLFLLNSSMTPSGAEHVLIDFLKTASEIEPVFLHIGPNKPDLDMFLTVTSADNCFYVPCTDLLRHPVSRQWFMELIRYFVCGKLLKDNTIKKLRDDNTISLVYFNNSFEAASYYPLFKDKRTIVHIHDMVDMFRPAQKRSVLEACRKCNRILTASVACKEMLVKNGIQEEKITAAYNSIDLEKKPYHKHDESDVCIGYVGSCIKRKGFDTYISILNSMKSVLETAGRRVRAIIITNSNADGAYVKENLANLNADIKREILCGIPREDVFKKYSEMDLLLVPSRNDPLPTVVLEAVLCGLPVFGSNIDGIPEMLSDEQFLFEVDNVNNAVEKITTWLSMTSEERTIRIERAQAHIESTFTKSNKKKCVFDAINAVLERFECVV